MPRTARTIRGGETYHVINRGNGRMRVFYDDQDYSAFLDLMLEATLRWPLRVFSACLMPNHFHLVVRPSADRDLARWMHWLGTCHAARHHRRYGTGGHVWQNRYKAFPIATDRHLLSVMRYVERNARRASLVRRAEHWPWSSAAWRAQGRDLPHPAPIPLPATWLALLNEAQSAAELSLLRRSVNRGTPYGDEVWQREAAERLGLRHTIRPPGRPPARAKV